MNPGSERQADVFLAGVRGKRPVVPADPARLDEAAREQISAEAFAYLAGGAGEQTMAANRQAFARRRIAPRMLRDVSERDLGVELFGRRLPPPFLLAPIGVLDLARRRGELLAARRGGSRRSECSTSHAAGASSSRRAPRRPRAYP